jgi:peptide/nickel transport system substrate-binding protein
MLMRKGRSTLKVAGVSVVLALLAAACSSPATSSSPSSSSSPSAKPRAGGTLSVAFFASWASLDPALAATSTSEQPMLSAIYGGLFNLGPDGSIQPDLATGYTMARDGKTLTLQLRHGVRFQDGTPFNAAAVKFNIQREQNPANACQCGSWLAPIASIATPTPYSVVLHLSQPDYSLIQLFASSYPAFIASPTAVRREGASFGLHPVGAGPFKVVSNAPSVRLVLQKWSGYWDRGRPYLSSLIFVEAENNATAYDSVLAGTDQAWDPGFSIPAVYLQESQSNADVTVEQMPATFWSFIAINSASPPFNNIEAREALFYATDVPAINKALYYGDYSVIQTLSAPGDIPHIGSTLPGYLSYDPAKARSLVHSLGGLSFTLFASFSNADFTELLEAFAKQWEAAGMQVTIESYQHPEVVTKLLHGDYQVAEEGYGEFPANTYSLDFQIGCSRTSNVGFCDPKVSQLLKEVTEVSSQSEQSALMERLSEDAIVKDAGIMPLFTNPDVLISNKNADLHGIPATSLVYFDQAWLG